MKVGDLVLIVWCDDQKVPPGLHGVIVDINTKTNIAQVMNDGKVISVNTASLVVCDKKNNE